MSIFFKVLYVLSRRHIDLAYIAVGGIFFFRAFPSEYVACFQQGNFLSTIVVHVVVFSCHSAMIQSL